MLLLVDIIAMCLIPLRNVLRDYQIDTSLDVTCWIDIYVHKVNLIPGTS